MGVGITNASTGSGGGSNFSATLQVATDANAVITAVNLAGDTFSGTANSSGSLTLTITEPGTYTITETGGTETKSVAIADNGQVYTVSIYGFDGKFITSGVVVVDGGMTAVGYSYDGLYAVAPTIRTATVLSETVITQEQPANNGSGIYRTSRMFTKGNFTSMRIRAVISHTSSAITYKKTYLVAVSSNNEVTVLNEMNNSSNAYQIYSASLSGLDSSTQYYFGVMTADQRYVSMTTLELV